MSSGARAAVATRADFDAKLAKELLIPSDFLDAKVEQREATREIKQPIWAAQRVEDTVLLGDLTSAVRPQSRRQRCANSPPARARPITIVVPAPAGGPRDTLARLLAEPMRTSLGQPVIIENVGGANGTIGTARVARAGPDGYTLVLGNWNSQMAASAFYPVVTRITRAFLISLSRARPRASMTMVSDLPEPWVCQMMPPRRRPSGSRCFTRARTFLTRLLEHSTPLPRRRAWLRIFVVRCSLPLRPLSISVGGTTSTIG
jgi:Tripartite tricarboxylate transporter family receptor